MQTSIGLFPSTRQRKRYAT